MHIQQTKHTACAPDAQSASLKADGSTSPAAVKPSRSTPPSVPAHFPLGWRTSSYSSSCSSSRIGLVSPHPIRCFPPAPPLIPSQELKPPSEAAKRPPGHLEEGGQRSPPPSSAATQQVLLSGHRSDLLHRLTSRLRARRKTLTALRSPYKSVHDPKWTVDKCKI